MERKRFIAWVAALSMLALPSFLSAEGMGHEGMHGAHDHGGMKMDDHGMCTRARHEVGRDDFLREVGPWTGEARLIDKKEYMEQSGVPAKYAARFAGERHLMMFLTDPMTGKAGLRRGGRGDHHGAGQGLLLEGNSRRDGGTHRRGRLSSSTRGVHVHGGDRSGRQEGERHVLPYVEVRGAVAKNSGSTNRERALSSLTGNRTKGFT